ncbi:large ribosomal subunit protein bL35m [Eucyclogobius newberryi]|uniref:large ribosomal subunit protein bL35m n=1 Tax=Eucyclogobius newberryi TaxID=166745 RepID=UPI003B599644
MAAAFARRACGLLRPIAVSLGSRTAQVCHLSSVVRPPRLCSFVLPRQSAALWAPLSLTPRTSILQRASPLAPSLSPPSRGLTYYSVKKGKRKTCKSVTDRFMRLHCGLWLRRKAGYKKKLWRKVPARRRRLREQVFCNKTQSRLLDKMTTSFWKRRNWFVNDPYLTYHDRNNLKV